MKFSLPFLTIKVSKISNSHRNTQSVTMTERYISQKYKKKNFMLKSF